MHQAKYCNRFYDGVESKNRQKFGPVAGGTDEFAVRGTSGRHGLAILGHAVNR